MASGVTVGAFRNRIPLRGEPNLEVAVRGPPSPRCSHLREHLGNEPGGTVRVGRRRPFESKLDAAKELYALWPPWSVARKRAACCSASRLRRLLALSLRLASSSRFLQFAIGGGSAVPEMHRQTFAIHPLAQRSSVQRTCTPSRRRRGTEHHVLSPCWDILSRGCRAPPSQLHAMCGSSCIFAYTVLQVVERFREAR